MADLLGEEFAAGVLLSTSEAPGGYDMFLYKNRDGAWRVRIDWIDYPNDSDPRLCRVPKHRRTYIAAEHLNAFVTDRINRAPEKGHSK